MSAQITTNEKEWVEGNLAYKKFIRCGKDIPHDHVLALVQGWSPVDKLDKLTADYWRLLSEMDAVLQGTDKAEILRAKSQPCDIEYRRVPNPEDVPGAYEAKDWKVYGWWEGMLVGVLPNEDKHFIRFSRQLRKLATGDVVATATWIVRSRLSQSIVHRQDSVEESSEPPASFFQPTAVTEGLSRLQNMIDQLGSLASSDGRSKETQKAELMGLKDAFEGWATVVSGSSGFSNAGGSIMPPSDVSFAT